MLVTVNSVNGPSITASGGQSFDVSVATVAPPVVSVSTLGVQGPQGVAGDASLTAVVLSESVSALRAVTFSGRLCTPQSAHEYAGITVQAGNIGDKVSVRRLGLLSDASFTFTAGSALFIGAQGQITQSPPSDYVLRIGTAVLIGEISLQPQQIIGVL